MSRSAQRAAAPTTPATFAAHCEDALHAADAAKHRHQESAHPRPALAAGAERNRRSACNLLYRARPRHDARVRNHSERGTRSIAWCSMFDSWRRRSDQGLAGRERNGACSELSCRRLSARSTMCPRTASRHPRPARCNGRTGQPEGASRLRWVLASAAGARPRQARRTAIVAAGFWASPDQRGAQRLDDAATVRINDLSHRGDSSLKVGSARCRAAPKRSCSIRFTSRC